MDAKAAAGFVRAARVADLPPGTTKVVIVGEREVALFNVAGEIFAIDNVCPHQGGPLAAGRLEGHIVTCPWHGWCFDVRSGKLVMRGEFDGVDTFAVRIEADAIEVGCVPRSLSS